MTMAPDAPDLPANPLSIRLSIKHERLWWHIDDEDHLPEQWEVSADVWDLDLCPAPLRHVADISLVIADLQRDRNLLDSIALGEWALEFIAETVLESTDGNLHPELDEQISKGPPRMVILRDVTVATHWRGHGLAGPLVAGALRTLAPTARLAAARVSPVDFRGQSPDRISAELASVRMAGMLERIGFYPWREVHVLDLRNPALLEARMSLLNHWWPAGHEDL
ncbi:hypothetical protein SAMN05421630_10884 [Prauserella marina]|uniref:Uncharacterized protein n=1 Tax=Prauserella marina TaxID=530584 RepID=A0A1G6UIU2_9PSEU|nr:hypothetical protein [Prauserella marina]PWV74769.1 hypothetical protein DES30_107167 [Prauserella marina]SDD41174.1 hypothetical protein SAMN05421630_10884 [Prauserella marina]